MIEKRSRGYQFVLSAVLFACFLAPACGPAMEAGPMPPPVPPPFSEKKSIDAPIFSSVLAAGDLDHDGRLDLVTANEVEEMAVLLNRGGGQFQLGGAYDARGNVADLALSDLSGNHKVDIILLVFAPKPGIVSYPAMGDGSFGAPTMMTAGGDPEAIVSADFNHDGKWDLAVAATGADTVTVQLSGMDMAQTYKVPRPRALVVADLNGDGHPDLVVGGDADGMDRITTLLGREDGSFTEGPVLSIGGTEVRAMAAADLDGDGKIDLAVANGGARITVLPGQGDGSFAAGRVIEAAPAMDAIVSLVISDFKGGHAGLAALVSPASPPGAPAFVSVMFGGGDGSFAAPLSFGQIDRQAARRASLRAGDVDGDGLPDLMVGDGKQISYFLNQTVPPMAPGMAATPARSSR